MIVCQIMLKDVVKVHKLFSEEVGIDSNDDELDCLLAVTAAVQANSLNQFQEAINSFAEQLEADLFIRGNLDILYHSILQDNIQAIIKPFSKLQISFIAHKIGLPSEQVFFFILMHGCS